MLTIFWVSFWSERKIFRGDKEIRGGGQKAFRWVKKFCAGKKMLMEGKKFVGGVKNF